MKLRFSRGDLVELPKRLRKNGGSQGVVVYSSIQAGEESTLVARIVDGGERVTVVPADELYRLPGRLEESAGSDFFGEAGARRLHPAGSSIRPEQLALGVG